MSRLIIKNLPPYVTPVRLREHFEQRGGPGRILTDVKVALKPDGTSRRFGFVGYKTEKEAGIARDYFDRTFIDSTRISVSVVQGAKDAPAPRPNKRPRLGPSPAGDDGDVSKLHKTTEHKSGASDAKPMKDDLQLDEFLRIMQPKKGPSWSNENNRHEPVIIPSPDKLTKAVVGDRDEVKSGGEKDAVEGEDGISDLDWMKHRMSKNVESIDVSTEKIFEQDEEMPDVGKNEPTNSTVEINSTKATILETSRLFVRNLAFSCSDEDLLELFRPFGEISQVHIPLDSLSKQPKGLAYVTFAQPTSALAACEALDKKSFQGRLIHILAAVNRKGRLETEENNGKTTVKGEKNLKRKAMAGKEFNWSMLYMNSDAVVSSIADRMNLSKADILNPESDNAAVKLALAETHVIQETKSYLESQGVVLSTFSSRTRSDTTILVKNIPYGTTAEAVRELFEPHGALTRVLVPPAGTMAVVEFAHADEANKGFRAVAYRRLGNSIIYLEKGPLGMFQDVEPGTEGPETSNGFKPVTIVDRDVDAEEPSLAAGTTLFIKNLSFATTTERLTQIFRHLPSFSFARVQTKPDPKRPDAPRLSMGYGFVGFKTVDAAKTAIKGMQGYVLDGHALHVKFAGRGAEEDTSKANVKSTTTKMIVKNVPFEATKKDIRALFGAHGNLKSVRIPKKMNARSRGFAFLDFVTRHEAENAYAALRHTHLLGRHLVLEWAEEAEQDLDALRRKAGVGYGGGAEMPGRKRKLDMGGDHEDAGADEEI